MNTRAGSKREEALEKRLGMSFADRGLLSLALTHPSAVNEDPSSFSASNQRLEFLGDAFIDFVVARELYRRLPNVPEGELTELRSAIVRGETLARVARNLSLGSFLYTGQGEEGSGGRERESNLAAAIEALVGALLLDQGSDVAYGITLGLLQTELERTVLEGVARDPKSRLQELAQSMGKGSPVYRTVDESGPEHLRVFAIEAVVDGQVMGTGSGHRKVDGERAAAQQALDVLENGS
ncbi:MAG: ribonuclease III [Chloroflexi bacterium]|nr:ribonuclease III [Chloroflexota bacterium]